MRSRAGKLATASTTWIFLVLVALVITFSALDYAAFASASNFSNIAIDASILLVVATGSTLVIITAGVDLSVGSVLVFASVIASKVMESGTDTSHVLLALAASVAVGAGWGLVNGFLVAYGRITPLIVTLGTLGMALGFALLISGGSDLRTVPISLQELGISKLPLGIPALAAVALATATLGGVLLRSTRFGRYTYAIGSNPEAVDRAGIDRKRHLLKVYALAGLLAGFAGFLFLARFGQTSLAGSATVNLNAITAVVLGGTSLFGGIGTMLGTVIGVLIPSVLQNGLVIAGLPPYWQQVAVGAVLIGAVYLDQLRRRGR